MTVSEYAKLMAITRAGAYYRIHHDLVPFYTRMGHYVIDEAEMWSGMEDEADRVFITFLMGKLGSK